MAGHGRGQNRRKGLTARMIQAAAVVADPDNAGKSVRELSEILGVPRETLSRWRQSDEFLAEVTRLARRAAQRHLNGVYDALAAKALEGNAAAIKIFLTHFDGYAEQSRSDVTVAPVTVQFSREELSGSERAQAMGESPEGGSSEEGDA